MQQYKIDIGKLDDTKNYNISKVLFIQSSPCIRTIKVAKALYEKGIQVDLIYLAIHPSQAYKDVKLPFKNIYHLYNINEMINYVNNSNYDILYSSNEPDYLTVLFSATNKPIVHDTHDMMSLRSDITVEQLVLEYIANVKSAGNIYVNPLIKNIAVNNYNLKDKPILTLHSFIEKEQLPTKYYEKLSKKDGEFHCVFEGGLAGIPDHHRYLEPIFLQLAQNHIHIHLHCPVDPEYIKLLIQKSAYIHFEELTSPDNLITEMTKYDIGLAIFNLTERNKTFLDTAFPNKIWDYLAAGLPILFADLLSFRQFAEESGLGKVLDCNADVKRQIEEVAKITIEKDILIKKKWLMNESADIIITFLAQVKEAYYGKNTNEQIDKYSTVIKTLKETYYNFKQKQTKENKKTDIDILNELNILKEQGNYLKIYELQNYINNNSDKVSTNKVNAFINRLEYEDQFPITEEIHKFYLSNDREQIDLIRQNKYTFVHIMNDNLFNKLFIKFINENFHKEDHLFIIICNQQLKHIKKGEFDNVLYEDLKYGAKFSIFNLLYYINKSKKVFFHYLHDFKCHIIANYKITSEINWKLWGGDLYSFVDINLYDEYTYKLCTELGFTFDDLFFQYKDYKNSYEFNSRIAAIKKINRVLSNFTEEFDEIKSHYEINAEHLKFVYPNPVDFKIIDNYNNPKNKSTAPFTILIGNSGSMTNNHVDILYKVKNISGDFRIFCPLSYGNNKYIQNVLTIGNSLFGDRFIPLTNFLEADEYYKLLSTVDVALINHNISEGNGTIFSLLYGGKKVYLKNNTAVYIALRKYGCYLYDISELDNLKTIEEIAEMDNEYKTINKKILLEKLDTKVMIEDMNIILNT